MLKYNLYLWVSLYNVSKRKTLISKTKKLKNGKVTNFKKTIYVNEKVFSTLLRNYHETHYMG